MTYNVILSIIIVNKHNKHMGKSIQSFITEVNIAITNQTGIKLNTVHE